MENLEQLAIEADAGVFEDMDLRSASESIVAASVQIPLELQKLNIR